jgi:hypothetical protein
MKIFYSQSCVDIPLQLQSNSSHALSQHWSSFVNYLIKMTQYFLINLLNLITNGKI